VTVEVQVLGRFAVRRDGAILPPFPRRDAAALVKLLALTPGHTLRTERAIDLLWPDQPLAETRPRLHKAAHYARRALGRPDAVVLRGEQVALCAGEDVVVDAESFETAAGAALAGDPAARADACAQVAGRFRGDLLPEDTAEPWTEDHRGSGTRSRARPCSRR
jgi:DNA-binding SARP family transcriptional activator